MSRDSTSSVGTPGARAVGGPRSSTSRAPPLSLLQLPGLNRLPGRVLPCQAALLQPPGRRAYGCPRGRAPGLKAPAPSRGPAEDGAGLEVPAGSPRDPGPFLTGAAPRHRRPSGAHLGHKGAAESTKPRLPAVAVGGPAGRGLRRSARRDSSSSAAPSTTLRTASTATSCHSGDPRALRAPRSEPGRTGAGEGVGPARARPPTHALFPSPTPKRPLMPGHSGAGRRRGSGSVAKAGEWRAPVSGFRSPSGAVQRVGDGAAQRRRCRPDREEAAGTGREASPARAWFVSLVSAPTAKCAAYAQACRARAWRPQARA